MIRFITGNTGSVQLLLHDYPQPVWQRELSDANSCINVLEYCAQIDQVAHHFVDLSIDGVPDRFDHLFTIPNSSPPDLGQVSQDLLQHVSHPYGRSSNLHTEGILKSGFGSQLDWNTFVTLPFNKSTPMTAHKTPLEMVLSSIQSSQFVGSSAPHGWGTLISPNNV
ncbi:hypothetical protein DM02DRAFT_673052 [Periconia macrospinosa]|uniref:Uncharacterized protein n=1 Tax=Periconia macrospinosa TaxID=97972 RepID=A0A2V1DLU8_9PLEO|nr:hypothetical protein DM02DRAFT_673052 [Periconia macrospinosa]